uniref:CX domain-containing protein n=1 Tax=Caenorhabditis tropicalis TaxID=1561998 RepID=A0A1I7TN63_9PELO
MPSCSRYEPIQGEVITTQPLPQFDQFEQEEPQGVERPTGWRLPLYYIVQAFTCFGDACVAICSCEEVDDEY